MSPVPSFFRKNYRGFTLVESLMAVTVMGLASVGIIAFLRQGMLMYYADRARVMINRDIRSFTTQIDSDAVTANYFCLYQDFTTRTLKSDGEVGDFLVLVYTDPNAATTGISMITELIGYYREVTNTTLNSGPVHRFDIKLAPANYVNATTGMTTILTNLVTGGVSSYPIVTQLAQGLATNTDGTTAVTPALFYNFKNRCVMIDTQIAESLTETGTTSQTGNTYNFTVSPRG
jgi:prepilin-type N-terminal cleavage/methylation domain-containing protein